MNGADTTSMQISLNRILTIFKRDFQDAVRDARILLMILIPFGIGVFYSFAFDDDTTTPTATVVYFSAGATTLPETMSRIAGGTVDLTVREVADANTVRQQIDDGDADLGLIVPAGFDAAVASNASPALDVLMTDSQDLGANYLAATVQPALREMAGQPEPARVSFETVGGEAETLVIDRLGIREYFVFAAILVQIAMIALLAMPSVLAVEREQRTLDALVMIASNREVIIAKACWGLVYIAGSVAILVLVADLIPVEPLPFIAGIGLLSLALVGFGLLLGRTMSANQLNSWGGVLLLPVIAPAFIIGTPAPDWLTAAANLTPTAMGARLAINGLAGETLFASAWLSVLGLLIWTVAGFGLLTWRMNRREA